MKNTKRNMIDIYNTIEKKINTINFEKLFLGFPRFEFALYNDNIVVMKDQIIPYDNRFIGNTSITYEGKHIAIWKIDTIYVHFNTLATKIVHEMFHAWQMKLQEKRFPNEHQGLFYHYEKYNISMKFDETKYLLKAYEDEDKNALEKFVNLRERRRRDYPLEVQFEEGVETIEGMATYVELEALKMLDVDEYHKAYDRLKDSIKNIGHYIPIRAVSYDVGALMIMVAKSLEMEYVHEIGEEDRPLYKLIFTDVPLIDFYYENTLVDLEFLDGYYQDILSRITNVLISNPRIHHCDYVVGFDPLNTFKIEKYVYYRHFVMIQSNDRQIFIRNEAVGELDEFGQAYLIYERQL